MSPTEECPTCKARLLPGFKHRECAPRDARPWQPWDEWLDAMYFTRRDGRLIAVMDDGSEVEVIDELSPR